MNNEIRDRVIEIVRDVYDRQAPVCDSADEIIELVEAALTKQQKAKPEGYAYEKAKRWSRGDLTTLSAAKEEGK